jgi:hypothetical protein
VIWFFHKGRDELRLETDFDKVSHRYIAMLHHEDGTRLRECFPDHEAFRRYLLDLQVRLDLDSWRRDRAQITLPHLSSDGSARRAACPSGAG